MDESAKGPLVNQYVGVIFDHADVQMGLSSSTILVSTSVTAAIPPPTYQPNFDKEQALRYAQLSEIAYLQYPIVQQKLPYFDLQAETKFFDVSTNTSGFIASNASSIVVVFRGTEIKSWKNIFTNLWFWRDKIISEETPPCHVHGGFLAAFNSVYSDIVNKLRPSLGTKELYVAGHSLGGALASILAYRISVEHPVARPVLYVYGCPPVGDTNFATYFKTIDCNTITITGDPVSSGTLILLGPWVGLYQPMPVKYLHRAAGHGIADYIKQLEECI